MEFSFFRRLRKENQVPRGIVLPPFHGGGEQIRSRAFQVIGCSVKKEKKRFPGISMSRKPDKFCQKLL
jgi:hypothetical protein